jgi:hypothetical protein
MENPLKNKLLLTGILAGIGAGIILTYIFCDDSCRYLKGSIWGIDLKYLGLVFLAALFTLNIFKKNNLFIALISLGIGGEIFLIGYQVVNATYCPYCLAFGTILILMFILNFDRTKFSLIALCLLLGLVFFLFFFTGSLTPVYAEDSLMTSFGSGPVEVRMYTDYFCAPCRAAEPEIESLLSKLMAKNAIRLTFIDTPMHKDTPLYAKYFLFILNGNKRSYSKAHTARSALFEAASQNIQTNTALEAFLLKKNLTFKPFDVVPIFKTFEKYIREDNIHATPSSVITGMGINKHPINGPNIIKELKAIMAGGLQKKAPLPAPSPGEGSSDKSRKADADTGRGK